MLETSHSQRLQRDLAAIRLLIAQNEGDDALCADLLSIEGMAATNLPKAARAENEYVTAPEINAIIAQQNSRLEALAGIDLSGIEWRIPSNEPSLEAETQWESLGRLRALLESAVLADEISAKEIRRLVSLSIRGEKVLWRELIDCGVYIAVDDAKTTAQLAMDRVCQAAMKAVGDDDRWCEVVWTFLEANQ